jgi:hypothetical protein
MPVAFLTTGWYFSPTNPLPLTGVRMLDWIGKVGEIMRRASDA